MAIGISSIPYFIVATLIFCYAAISLLSTYDNSIKVGFDGQRHLDISSDNQNDSPSLFLSSTKIEAIYQFGDSISDTGNFIRENPESQFAKLPYGKTFFHKPTGRCSDGLLMIDYFTKILNLPFLDPYLNKEGNFTHGVNFAVAGSTALTTSTLAMKGISTFPTNSSLLVQLQWFKSHLTSLCSTISISDCKEKMAKALFMIGEIGGNDYNWAFFERKPIEEIYKMVPEVVQTIKAAIKEVINLGAIHIVVPGNFPIGCITVYLNMFKTNDSSMYDELQCLKHLNNFAKFHNNKLQEVVGEIQKEHQNVKIMYADYFLALQEIIRHQTSFGFDKGTIDKACCVHCGSYTNPVCENPYTHINWDSVHLTQHAYQIMASWLIKNMFHGISYVV